MRKRRAFLDAVLRGDAAQVQQLLAAGVAADTRDLEHDETALMLAARFGHIVVVALLLRAGADPNAMDNTGRTPLMYAKAACLPLVHDAGANLDAKDQYGETALMKAAGNADFDKVNALLEQSANRHLTDQEVAQRRTTQIAWASRFYRGDCSPMSGPARSRLAVRSPIPYTSSWLCRRRTTAEPLPKERFSCA